MFNIPEGLFRFFIICVAQAILGILLFFVFRHFSDLYRRQFIQSWAGSWAAFFIYMIATAIVSILNVPTDSFWRIVLTITAQFACFMQMILILRGTHEFVSDQPYAWKKLWPTVAIAFVVAIVVVLIFTFDPEGASYRQLLRAGSRTFVLSLGFLITGIVVWSNRKFSKGFGQKLFGASLIFFGFWQIHHFVIALLNFVRVSIFPGPFFGVIDLLLVASLGISMIIWLLEDERRKLEKANRELDSFLYSTSHDLRAPIASILGLTYLGKMEFEEEKARSFMELIEERIRKLDAVIGDILSLARAKKLDLKIQRIRFDKLVDDATSDIKFNKGASAIALDYKPSRKHVFNSDYNQMKVVLSNLLGNAVKYHNLDQPHPYIRIRFRRQNQAVEIRVEDNGKGIPEESLPKIFDMFYRASSDTEGTGLGLYIVREALGKIRGSIHVNSTFGKGSAFTIVLERA